MPCGTYENRTSGRSLWETLSRVSGTPKPPSRVSQNSAVMLGFEEIDSQKGVSILADLIKDGGIHVLPIHAEVEGGIFQNQFRELLKDAINMGIEIVPLKVIKDKLDVKTLPKRKYKMELLPGRHSPCAV